MINQYISDSVAFGLPLLYSKQLPDQKVRDITARFRTIISSDDAKPHRIYWAYHSPEPASLQIHFNDSLIDYSLSNGNCFRYGENMLKLRRAVFCYYILRFQRRLHTWLVSIVGAMKQDGLLAIDDNELNNIPGWFTPLLDAKLDFDSVLKILSGDAFYTRNKTDVAKLQSEIGKPITQLWDTDPIFAKYPHLRMLARNEEFENAWPKMKEQNKKEKQK